MKDFEKIIGYEAIKKEVDRICDVVANFGKYEKLGVKVPKGLMFHGAPGVGKTLFATCFLEASGRKSYICRKNLPDGEFIRFLKDSFEEAKKNVPAIILLDDIDKFATNSRGKNTEEFSTIQSCIDDVKNYDIFVVATANDIACLPDSLLRAGRFDTIIEVKNPRGEDAEKIISHYLKSKQYVKDIDVQQLAKMLNGSSCAELECIINQAGMYAGYNNQDAITFDDVVRACIRKIYAAPETITNSSKEDDENTAYHEAGHAVVAELLEQGTVTMVSIGGHEGCVGGFTSYYRTESYWHDIERMKNRVMCLLGGKCAVEIKYGKVDVGCVSDLERASNIIHRFITEYGTLGMDKCNPTDFIITDNFKYKQEQYVSSELIRYYQKTKELLTANREFLEKVAERVLDKKLLIASDIKEIRESLQNSGQN